MSNPFDALDEPSVAVNPFDALDDAAPQGNPFDDLDDPAPAGGGSREGAGSNLGRAWERGKARARQLAADVIEGPLSPATWLPGMKERVQAAADVERASAEALAQRNAQAPDRRFLGKAIDATVESVLPGIPSVIGAVAGGLIGGSPGAAVGMGLGSAAGEYGGSVDDFLRERGVDFTNPDQIRAAYGDANLMAQAREYAGKRAAVIGAADAAAGGIAGRVAGKLLGAGAPVRAALSGLSIDAAGGSAGEAGAQLATEGRVTDWEGVALEAAASLATGGPELAASVLSRREPAGVPGSGARIVDMPKLTPEYIARQRTLSYAGAAPGRVSPAAGNPTASIPAGTAPAPFVDMADSGDRVDVPINQTGSEVAPWEESVLATSGDRGVEINQTGTEVAPWEQSVPPTPTVVTPPAGGVGGTPTVGSTPVSRVGRSAASTKPVSVERQISDAISAKKGWPVEKGRSVDFIRRTKNDTFETLKARIVQVIDENTVRIEYTGLTHTQKKLKLPTEVPVDQIHQPANVEGNRRRAAFLRQLPKEEQKAVRAASTEFNQTLAMIPEFYDVRKADQLSTGPAARAAGKQTHWILKQAREIARKELGLPDGTDMSNPVEQARALPLLKAWMAEQEARDAAARSANSANKAPVMNGVTAWDSDSPSTMLGKKEANAARKYFMEYNPGILRELASLKQQYPFGAYMVDLPVKELQPGNGLDQAYIDKIPDTFGPITVNATVDYSSDKQTPQFVVEDGNHRVAAAKKRGKTTIKAIVYPWDQKGMDMLSGFFEAFPGPAPEFSPSGQGQLPGVGQGVGGFKLVGEQVQPGGPSMDELEAARRAQEEHLRRMGDLFDDPPPEPTSSDEDVPFSGAMSGADQMEAQPGRQPPPPGPPGAPPVRGMDDVRLPFRGPELLKLWRGMGGMTPKVFEKLAGGRALGLFRGKPDGEGVIELAADAARMVTDKERADLLGEARQEAQAEQDARIAAGVPPMTPVEQAQLETRLYQDRLRLREEWARANRGQEQFAKVFAHEIGHAEKWFAAIPRTLNFGNILGQIAGLVGFAKKTLAEHPSMPDLWMTSAMRRQIRRMAEQAVGPRPPVTQQAARAQWKTAVKREYADLLDREAASRGYLQRKDAEAEIVPLVKWWRGVQTLTPYHLQPREMYADVMSMFLLAPGQLEARAPRTFYVLDQWIQTNRTFYKAYQDIQKRIATGGNLDDRTVDLRQRMMSADKRKSLLARARDSVSWEETRDSLLVVFDRVRGPLYRSMGVLKRMDPARYERDREAVKSDVYQSSRSAAVLAEANAFSRQYLGEKGWTWLDFGEYLFHRRVVWERANLANPGAMDSVASQQRLDEWQASTPPEKWQGMLDAEARWREIHRQILREVQALEVVDPELMAYMLGNDFYATFDVVRDQVAAAAGSIDEMLLSAKAPTPGSAVRRQKGTLQDITNPATATLEKQLALLAFAYKNRAKRTAAELLRDYEPHRIQPAKVAFIDKRPQVVRREGDRVGTLIYKQNGRDVGFYVPKGIAAAFDRGPGGAIGQALGYARWVSGSYQALWTAWNPLAWPTLAIKDVLGTVARAPGASLWFGDRAIVKKLGQAWKASRSLHAGSPNPDAVRALERMMLQGVRDSNLADRDDVGIEKLMREFAQNPMGALPQRGVKGTLAKWNRLGQTFEHAVKIAGMLWADQHKPDWSEAQKRQFVRVNVGSPEFMDRGQGAPILNLFKPFFNAAKQGWRAQVEARELFDSKTEYAVKLISYAILPRMAIRVLQGAMVYAAAKALGWGEEEAEEERKAMWAAIPARDRMLYLCIPVGWYDRGQGKVAYLRIPQDETSALIGGMFESAVFDPNDTPGMSDVMAFAVSRFETGQNNLAKLGTDWFDYYFKGEVAIDKFTDRPIIPQKYADAGGLYAAGALGKHTYNQMPEQFRLVASILPGVPGRFDLTDRPEQKKGLAEELARTPGVSRFFRISNGGVYDIKRAEDVKQDKARAPVLIEIERAAARLIDKGEQPGEKVRRMLADPKNAQYWREKVKAFRAGREDAVGQIIKGSGSAQAKRNVEETLRERGLR